MPDLVPGELICQAALMKTLVLLHGLASNSTRWWHFAANTRLREGWKLLRPDLRGHAGSSDRGRPWYPEDPLAAPGVNPQAGGCDRYMKRS